MQAFVKHFILIALVINLCVYSSWGQSPPRDHSSRHQRNEQSRPDSSDESAEQLAAAKRFLGRIDANHNGIIEAEEVPESHRSIVESLLRRVGVEPKYPLDLSKLGASASASNGDGSNAAANKESRGSPSRPSDKPGNGETKSAKALPSDSKPTASKPGGSPSSPPQRSFIQRSAKERLPKGLPDWFREKDDDDDGQVMMYEFARRWTVEIAAEFDHLDLNHDGIITPSECLKAQKRSAARGK